MLPTKVYLEISHAHHYWVELLTVEIVAATSGVISIGINTSIVTIDVIILVQAAAEVEGGRDRELRPL